MFLSRRAKFQRLSIYINQYIKSLNKKIKDLEKSIKQLENSLLDLEKRYAGEKSEILNNSAAKKKIDYDEIIELKDNLKLAKSEPGRGDLSPPPQMIEIIIG